MHMVSSDVCLHSAGQDSGVDREAWSPGTGTKNEEVDGNGIYPENCMQSAALHRPVGHTMDTRELQNHVRPPADRLGP